MLLYQSDCSEISKCQLVPVFLVKLFKPYFLTRPHARNLVWRQTASGSPVLLLKLSFKFVPQCNVLPAIYTLLWLQYTPIGSQLHSSSKRKFHTHIWGLVQCNVRSLVGETCWVVPAYRGEDSNRNKIVYQSKSDNFYAVLCCTLHWM